MRILLFKTALIFTLGSVVFFACRSKEVAPELPPDHIELRMGTSVLMQNGLTVIADTVNISICPPNASCIVPDNVSASVRLVKGKESKSVRLFAWIGDYTRRDYNTSDSTNVELGGQSYKVILKGRHVNKPQKALTGQAILQVSPL